VGKFAAACITIQSGSPWFPPLALFLRGHCDLRHSAVPDSEPMTMWWGWPGVTPAAILTSQRLARRSDPG
jgi:hypothetical protein